MIVLALQLYFLFKLMFHVSLEMIIQFTGTFTGQLPWDS